MYETAGDDRDKQVDIGARLVSRMSDDDDGVKVSPFSYLISTAPHAPIRRTWP